MSDVVAEPQFPAQYRATLKQALSDHGLDGARTFIAGFTEPRQRAQLWRLAASIASHDLRPFLDKAAAAEQPPWWTLDQLAELYQAGIDEALFIMDGATNAPEDAHWFKQAANILSYNLAADLAPCWPGDDQPREVRHYELGVATMRRAIRWRIELSKPAENMALAYWALGIHLLGLGEHADSVDAFNRALDYSRVAASEYGRKAEVSADGDWSVVLNSGFLGLARALGGDDSGTERYGASLLAFKAMGEDHPDLASDAKLGVDQLEKSARVFGLKAEEPPTPQ